MYVKYIFYIMCIYIYIHTLCNVCWEMQSITEGGEKKKSGVSIFFFFLTLLLAWTKYSETNE